VYDEDDLLPISALQHLLFCERQVALIHVERLWAENRLTVEGQHLHQKAHDGPVETRPGCRTVRGLPLRCLRLGMHGVADVVELRDTPSPDDADPGDSGIGTVMPVEYKRGKSKIGDYDRVQLCAQALCLEEMLDVSVTEGAIFYGQTRRREAVPMTEELRHTTESAATRLRELIDTGTVPRVQREPKCDRCSLLHLCLPDATRPNRSAKRYFQRALSQLARETSE